MDVLQKKYEVDSSFDTDVEGEYIYSMHGFVDGGDTYDLDISYQLNDGIYKSNGNRNIFRSYVYSK